MKPARIPTHKRFVFSAVALLLLTIKTPYSEELDAQQRALDIIGDFADRTCTRVPLEGEATNVQLSGQAKADLSNVLQRIADLGLKGSAKYDSTYYQGVLQKELAATIKDSDNCRLKVFEKLLDILLPQSPPGSVSDDAVEDNFKSSNPSVRAHAFRQAFQSVSSFHITLSPLEGASKKNVDRMGGFESVISSQIRYYDVNTGKFGEKDPSRYTHIFVGNISGDIIRFNSSYCSGTLENVADTWQFVGIVSCSMGNRYKGEFTLR